MSRTRQYLMEELEWQAETERQNAGPMPWVPGKIMREGARCAMCDGELNPHASYETDRGELVHECYDCGAAHRAILSKRFKRWSVHRQAKKSQKIA